MAQESIAATKKSFDEDGYGFGWFDRSSAPSEIGLLQPIKFSFLDEGIHQEGNDKNSGESKYQQAEQIRWIGGHGF